MSRNLFCLSLFLAFTSTGCSHTVPITIQGTVDTDELDIMLARVCENTSPSGFAGIMTPGFCIVEMQNLDLDEDGSFLLEAESTSSTTDLHVTLVWDDNNSGECEDGERWDSFTINRDDESSNWELDFVEPTDDHQYCPYSL